MKEISGLELLTCWIQLIIVVIIFIYGMSNMDNDLIFHIKIWALIALLVIYPIYIVRKHSRSKSKRNVK